MIKVQKYFCCLCLNLLFKFLPWQVAAACPYPRKWNRSYPTRCLSTVWGHRSLRAPALVLSWNTKLPVGNCFNPFWTEEFKWLFHFIHKLLSDTPSRGLVQSRENPSKLKYFKMSCFCCSLYLPTITTQNTNCYFVYPQLLLYVVISQMTLYNTTC